MWVAFALQKLLTFLQQKYQYIWKYLSYNSQANDILNNWAQAYIRSSLDREALQSDKSLCYPLLYSTIYSTRGGKLQD